MLDSVDGWIRQYGARFAGITTLFGYIGYFLGRIFGPSIFSRYTRESYLHECEEASWRILTCNRFTKDIIAERVGHEAFKYGEEYGPIMGSTALVALSYVLVTGIALAPWVVGCCRTKKREALPLVAYEKFKKEKEQEEQSVFHVKLKKNNNNRLGGKYV